MPYITIKIIDYSIRYYDNKKEATEHARKMNFEEKKSPSFWLYRLNGDKKAIFCGKLCRKFGTKKLYWTKDKIKSYYN